MFGFITLPIGLIIILIPNDVHSIIKESKKNINQRSILEKSSSQLGFPIKYHEEDILTPIEAHARRKQILYVFGVVAQGLAQVFSSGSGVIPVENLPCPPQVQISTPTYLGIDNNKLFDLQEQKRSFQEYKFTHVIPFTHLLANAPELRDIQLTEWQVDKINSVIIRYVNDEINATEVVFELRAGGIPGDIGNHIVKLGQMIFIITLMHQLGIGPESGQVEAYVQPASPFPFWNRHVRVKPLYNPDGSPNKEWYSPSNMNNHGSQLSARARHRDLDESDPRSGKYSHSIGFALTGKTYTVPNRGLDHIVSNHGHEWGINDVNKEATEAAKSKNPEYNPVRTRTSVKNRQKLLNAFNAMSDENDLVYYPNYPMDGKKGEAYLSRKTGLFVGIDENKVIRRAYQANRDFIRFLNRECR